MFKYHVDQELGTEEHSRKITKSDLERIQNYEYENLQLWADRSVLAADYVNETNKFFRENSRQWGYKKGVNSGNGKLEARIPEYVLYMKLQEDPAFLQDDKSFEKWLNSNPQYKV